MSILTVLPLAAEAEESAGAWPFLVGGAILLVLVAALVALVTIGGGREHS